MKKIALKAAFAGVAMSLIATAAQALPVSQLSVASYDMLNGNTGSFTYWDDSYNGTGSTTTSGAPLSGGTGDLTDGVIATQNWFNTPQPYVGWTRNPLITFNFAAPVIVNSITVHVDDAYGAGGVSTPASLSYGLSGGSLTNVALADPAGSAPTSFTIGNLNLSGSAVDLQFFRRSSWVFVSEVEFFGSVQEYQGVSEPLTLGLLGAGLLGVGLARRRQK